jgi:hypothetical protein
MPDFLPHLNVGVIWYDVDLVRLRITAASEHFAGQADVYASHEQLLRLATDLAGFPKDIGDRRTFQFATSTGGNSVSLEFWVTNSLGLTPVDAQIIETEASREFASVRLCIEPARRR